jgi:hypothetical protein
MEPLLNAKQYREIADFLERELDELTSYGEEIEKLSLSVVGDLQYFSRPAPEVRILGQQLGIVQDQVSEAVEILHTLANIAELKKKFPIHPLLVVQMQNRINSYIDYYNNRLKQETSQEGKGKEN